MSPRIIGPLANGLCSLALCGLPATFAFAQPPAQQAAERVAEPLPLGRVVMFSSGVGFFEHAGEVAGDKTVELKFRVEDINDLLKSMILEDRDGGTISTVSYGSRDPITKTLKTFPVDLTGNPTLGQILNQVRGERVTVDAPNAISGVLLGVETRKREVGENRETVNVEFLNLLTDEGLRSISLESIGRIKLANEKLDADLRQALTVLAAGHNTDKKSVTLDLRGNGNRRVRVAYIQETPIWKTSYRLVLDDKGKPFLQGWAIVENTTEGDWNNVNLTLISGRPISYRMDLYEPLYVQRPLETLNLFASLRAQTYGQDLADADEKFRQLAESRNWDELTRTRNAQGRAGGRGGAMAGMGGMRDEAAAKAIAPAAPAASEMVPPNGRFQARGEFEQLAAQSAQSGEVGELFQYEIKTPVTLARQKSAMLPIVNEDVSGDKVSIYNENVQAKHPLNGLRLTNSTKLHLMQGPITVFDGGAYAGDAKIEDLAPGAERLISYALDLKTEVAPEGKDRPEQLQSIRLSKGVMHATRKLARARQYTVKNSDTKDKTVLIEYPLDANWKLTAPEKPSEKTRDRYRFAVKAEPGKPATLTVEEEQVINQQWALTNMDDNSIIYYSNQKVVSAAVKAALQEVIKRKAAIQLAQQERQRIDAQINTIGQEQNRIRQNMQQLDRASDLYKRYVQMFSSQEDDVARLREQSRKLEADEAKLRQSLDEYLMGLELS